MNVKEKPPRDPDDDPFIFLPVKVKFNGRGPSIYLRSGNANIRLSEEDVFRLDNIDIVKVDLDIRPYDWEVNGDKGRSAYLESMLVVQRTDRFNNNEEDLINHDVYYRMACNDILDECAEKLDTSSFAKVKEIIHQLLSRI